MDIKALTFDVFGTVVDWRSSVIEESAAFGARHGINADWPTFDADECGRHREAEFRP